MAKSNDPSKYYFYGGKMIHESKLKWILVGAGIIRVEQKVLYKAPWHETLMPREEVLEDIRNGVPCDDLHMPAIPESASPEAAFRIMRKAEYIEKPDHRLYFQYVKSDAGVWWPHFGDVISEMNNHYKDFRVLPFCNVIYRFLMSKYADELNTNPKKYMQFRWKTAPAEQITYISKTGFFMYLQDQVAKYD